MVHPIIYREQLINTLYEKDRINPGFVRSLFAHCSLFVRFIGEGTAIILNRYSNFKMT